MNILITFILPVVVMLNIGKAKTYNIF